MEQPLKRDESFEDEQLAETARWETPHDKQNELEHQNNQSNYNRYNEIQVANNHKSHMSNYSAIDHKEEDSPMLKNNQNFVKMIKTSESLRIKQNKQRVNDYPQMPQRDNETENQNQFIIKQKEGEINKREENKNSTIDDLLQNGSNFIGFQLQQCSTCGRKFMIGRLEKHSKICQKLNNKRQVFNSKLKRVEDSVHSMEIQPLKLNKDYRNSVQHKISTRSPLPDKFLTVEQNRSTAATQKRAQWKINHQNFLKSIRSVKVNPNDPQSKSFHVPLENPDYVFCKFCERRFAPNVAETHIPKCEHVFNRPKPPSQRKTSFLKAINPSQKKQQKKLLPEPKSSMTIINNRKIQPLQIHPKQTRLQSIQVTPVANLSKPKAIIIQQPETFAGILKNYQNVETRSSNYSNIQCPYCTRKFATKAAQRHIPICQQLQRNKGCILKQIRSKQSGSASKLEINQAVCCKHCGFRFCKGHKYCSNCGKKRGQ